MSDPLQEARRLSERLGEMRDWFWDAAEMGERPQWCRAQSDTCDEALETLTALAQRVEDAERERDRAVFVGETNEQSFLEMRTHYDKKVEVLARENERLRELLGEMEAEFRLRATQTESAPYTPESLRHFANEIRQALQQEEEEEEEE